MASNANLYLFVEILFLVPVIVVSFYIVQCPIIRFIFKLCLKFLLDCETGAESIYMDCQRYIGLQLCSRNICPRMEESILTAHFLKSGRGA